MRREGGGRRSDVGEGEVEVSSVSLCVSLSLSLSCILYLCERAHISLSDMVSLLQFSP